MLQLGRQTNGGSSRPLSMQEPDGGIVVLQLFPASVATARGRLSASAPLVAMFHIV